MLFSHLKAKKATISICVLRMAKSTIVKYAMFMSDEHFDKIQVYFDK